MDTNYLNSPYKDIPLALLDRYTMDGKIPILTWWRDDRNALETPIWNDAYLDVWINNFTIEKIKNNTQGWEPYAGAALLLLTSFEKYNIVNKNVAVVGSIHPWIESILLNLNNNVTTIEYNVPFVDSKKKLNSKSYNNFKVDNNKYDAIITYSSIEHSGLGRYGDPLDPDGDIDTINTIHDKLEKNGLLILGVPVGHDVLVWNVHRVYGHIRLNKLLKQFKELVWIGGTKEYLLNKPLENNGEQPVIVLEKINNVNI